MENITYTQAVTEIETILRSMESEDFDIDNMAAQVKRATQLIKLCRSMLKKAGDDVEEALNG